MTDPAPTLDERSLRDIADRYENDGASRTIRSWLAGAVFVFLVCFALYHYYTAGFGLPVDHWHMGIHLAGVLAMVFILFPAARASGNRALRTGWLNPGGVPLYDWACGLLGAAASLWIGLSWEGFDFSLFGTPIRLAPQSLRQGNPAAIDVVFGTLLIFIVLEATRRAIGIVLPIIVACFMLFALFGPSMPLDILKHPGVQWSQFVNNIYFPDSGMFGIPLWVVSTVVFHFVLFGSIAQRMGLGKLFVDLSTVAAGRYVGGPAKVSVVSSALFGTISGSAVANVVSTGALTIPNMKRLGYSGHFAGGVEAAASAGGQVTPPIMGAAAFIMAEYLAMPYAHIALAATLPALMHYVGVLTMVHFEAKRLGLKGQPREEMPKLLAVLRQGWPAAIPLIALLYVLFSGYTPYMAAFWGITLAIAIGLINPMHRMSLRDVVEAFHDGAKAALAVGAICAAVGIVVGVITLTGLAFRLGFMVTSAAQDVAGLFHASVAWLPWQLFSLYDATHFLSMVFIAIACILMGAGVPTTALYIMLVTVAQPAFTNLGIPPLATHMFVLYYGIISEVTPPVCTSAYAAAAIAGSNPWKTGFAAFKLSVGKLLVPFVFCYSPALLLVLPGYSWLQILQTALTCIGGIVLLAMAFIGYARGPIAMPFRVLLALAGLFLVAPGGSSDLIAAAIAVPFLVYHYLIAAKPEPATP